MTFPVISCAIMAHPSRRERAEQLAAQLDRLSPTIVYDPDPTGPPSAMKTARLAWSSFSSEATHHLVLQDDVSVPPNFVDLLVAAVTTQPERLIGLSTDWSSKSGQAVRIAALGGFQWAPMLDRNVWAVSVLMPSDWVEEFLAYLTIHPDDRDSAALREFLRRRGSEGVSVVPNLVDHDRPYIRSMWARNVDQGPRRAALRSSVVDTSWFKSDAVAPVDQLNLVSTETVRAMTGVVRPYGEFAVFPTAELFQAPEFERIASQFYERVETSHRKELELTSPAHLFQCWLVATLTHHRKQADLPPGLLAECSRTLFTGSLKRMFSPSQLDALETLSMPWLEEAFVDDSFEEISGILRERIEARERAGELRGSA
ncbi:hypothetical protein [Nocardiopsis dassonvillei]|uniref:hypothetical protein n=1 Tax=Nocardiopsis dassonvillei TaxID=2014 RepID=UPI003670DDED